MKTIAYLIVFLTVNFFAIKAGMAKATENREETKLFGSCWFFFAFGVILGIVYML